MTCLATLGKGSATAEPHSRCAEHRLTQDQIIEVFGHMTLYSGIPFARGAMDIANEIFTDG